MIPAASLSCRVCAGPHAEHFIELVHPILVTFQQEVSLSPVNG